MFLKKTIVLVALAAATAAPSALAIPLPPEGDSGPGIVQRDPGAHPKVKPGRLCDSRAMQVRPVCLAPTA